jgi:hypothetical protein
MFEQAVEASEAMRQNRNTLVPAMCGCRTCRTVEMIASPALGRCVGCGTEMEILDPSDPAFALRGAGKWAGVTYAAVPWAA